VIDWSSALLGGFGFVVLAMIGLVITCAVYDHRRRAGAA
jgi:hypothetical protein